MYSKNYFTIGTTSTPCGPGALWIHFKEKAVGGDGMVTNLYKTYQGKAVIERSGTGYMTRHALLLCAAYLLSRSRRRTWTPKA